MLQDRLGQAKRKLDSPLSEPLHANKRNTTVLQVEFSSRNSDACHVEGPTRAPESHNLQGPNDVVPTKGYPDDSSRQPMKAPKVNAPPQADNAKHVDQGLFVEIFAGAAGLTAAVRKIGLHSSIGIDSAVNTNCKAPVIRLDLRLEHARTLLWQVLNRPNLIGVHLAPPCGTASRAREIVRKSGPSPPPLRSERWPDGFPWLRGLNRDRVKSANMLSFAIASTLGCLYQSRILHAPIFGQRRIFQDMSVTSRIRCSRPSSTIVCTELANPIQCQMQ